MMKQIVLMGDSIFDNVSYTQGGPSVIDQLRSELWSGDSASLLAVDGDTTINIAAQIRRVPLAATHLVLSVGGNDALRQLETLQTPAHSVYKALETLASIAERFNADYRNMLKQVMAMDKPLMVCSIYDSVPGLTPALKTALTLFNDVIVRAAIENALPVLDLRRVCREAEDYSALSPIEPSSHGGAKIAKAIARALSTHDYSIGACRVYV
jgi:lysophospholipase L1-like esterase